MIEAVNSVLANASLARVATGQGGQDRAEVSRSEVQVPQAPYISPYISVDNSYNQAVIQIRDSDTGDVLNQFPSESRLRERAQQAAELEASIVEPSQNSNPQFEAAQSTQRVQEPQQSSSFVAQSISAEAPSVNVPAGTAQAQIASAALSSGAQSGQPQAASVSVTA